MWMLSALATTDTVLEQIFTLNGLLGSAVEFWLWATLAMLIAEIFTSGFFLGALAISSLLTAGGAGLAFTPTWQVAFFAASSIGSMLWLRPVFVNLLAPDDVATNTSALVGKVGTVIEQVPAGGIGRVRLINEEWRATASESLNVGDGVTVISVEGNTLKVGPA